jgi:uncharacterized DUF497 family protein
MLIEFDPGKRTRTLARRGLDFGDAVQVFADLTCTYTDKRFDDGEERAITLGKLKNRWVWSGPNVVQPGELLQ